ncbi:ABC transporter permease [Streptacidiphilus fuscans]|uniref:ABC transporter permease n=1 Tax=Streptacidiphilus fuscans TaxID=2789292 RepID=A0A931BB79_9ACTN|nr:ABC transporter permease [Streptacidiphilus fuscans]MBF9072042.1 ABC transporter permease [Streptacidiphilus fuscans]
MSLSEYVNTRWNDLVNAAGQHALIVAIAVALGAVIGIAIGVATWQRPRIAAAAIAVTGGFLTIPSFALLGLLIPLLGLGWTPTLTALTLYSLLPIVRNTVVGLQAVDPALTEAARGLGLSSARVMLRVRLPLAWPVILTGIRVSTQMIIGIAAIAAFVAGPGLGNQIFDGLATLGSVNSLNETIAGTVGVIVLALLFDLFYVIVRRLTTSRGIRA